MVILYHQPKNGDDWGVKIIYSFAHINPRTGSPYEPTQELDHLCSHRSGLQFSALLLETKHLFLVSALTKWGSLGYVYRATKDSVVDWS
jgi:hypothetical protein